MRVVADRLGVQLECFASPLNCHLPLYCSAFADTDAPFGSLGSFFELSAQSGSFEANPPFVPGLMAEAVRHATMLLSSATGPMSFCFVVPGWQEDPGNCALHASAFRTASFVVAAADHGFVDGAQHQRQDRYQPAPFDTTIVMLQNKLGEATWPLDGKIEGELRAALALSMPNEASLNRRRKAGRYIPRSVKSLA